MLRCLRLLAALEASVICTGFTLVALEVYAEGGQLHGCMAVTLKPFACPKATLPPFQSAYTSQLSWRLRMM